MLHLEQVLKYNFFFCLQELRMISVVESFLFNLIRLPLFMTLLILIFSPHNILGNLPDLIWHQKDMLLPLEKQINSFSPIGWWKSSAVLSIAMATEDGISQWNQIYIYTEKSSSLKAWSLFCCHVYNTINAINYQGKDTKPFYVGVEWDLHRIETLSERESILKVLTLWHCCCSHNNL